MIAARRSSSDLRGTLEAAISAALAGASGWPRLAVASASSAERVAAYLLDGARDEQDPSRALRMMESAALVWGAAVRCRGSIARPASSAATDLRQALEQLLDAKAVLPASRAEDAPVVHVRRSVPEPVVPEPVVEEEPT